MPATVQPPAISHKVLIVIGDAAETIDTLYPIYRLNEAGFQPVVIAPERRVYQMVLHEVRPGWTITKEWEGYQIQADLAFADVHPDDYLGIFFSRGTSSPKTSRWAASATAWKFRLTPGASRAAGWRPCPNVGLTSKWPAASSSTSRV